MNRSRQEKEGPAQQPQPEHYDRQDGYRDGGLGLRHSQGLTNPRNAGPDTHIVPHGGGRPPWANMYSRTGAGYCDIRRSLSLSARWPLLSRTSWKPSAARSVTHTRSAQWSTRVQAERHRPSMRNVAPAATYASYRS